MDQGKAFFRLPTYKTSSLQYLKVLTNDEDKDDWEGKKKMVIHHVDMTRSFFSKYDHKRKNDSLEF